MSLTSTHFHISPFLSLSVLPFLSLSLILSAVSMSHQFFLLKISFFSSLLSSFPPSSSSFSMFHLVLVYLCSFSLLHFSYLVHGTIRLNEGPTAGHRVDASYLPNRGEFSSTIRELQLVPINVVSAGLIMFAQFCTFLKCLCFLTCRQKAQP